MTKTVVGLFDTRTQADQAVQALFDSGIERDNVSVVANDKFDTANETTGTEDSTAAGAATGAVGGGVLGGALGLLVGLGALAIPGIGPIIAAGPIAAALGAAGTTALVGAGIGAVSGGLLGALIGAGIPEEDAHYYAEGVRRGGTLVMAKVDDSMAGSAYNVMQQYGAIDIDNRGTEYRENGWDRFDPEGGEWERSSKVGTTGGAVAGAVTGAAMGSVGGPIGTAVGGIAGAAVGAGVGAAGDAIGEEATEETRGTDYDADRATYNTTREPSTPISGDIDPSAPVMPDTTSDTTYTTRELSVNEPVMSDRSDAQPVIRTEDSEYRSGGRIYGEGGRYDWDESTRSAVLLGAANTSGIVGSTGGNSATGLGAVAATNALDNDPDRDYNREYRTRDADTPAEDWEESSKVGTATGTVAGAATGAAIGAVGGPVGAVVGGVAGAVTGGAVGAAGDAAGEATEDTIEGEDNYVEGETTNDVGGRKGQVKPRE